jgi:hypothetical protein
VGFGLVVVAALCLPVFLLHLRSLAYMILWAAMCVAVAVAWYLARQLVLVSSMNFGSTLLWSVLGGTSLPSDGVMSCDPGREGWDPSSELENTSWSPFVHGTTMQAVCLRMMLPTAPASPSVGVREDDGLGVSSEASRLSFVCLFLCVSCQLCKCCMHYVSTSFVALLI